MTIDIKQQRVIFLFKYITIIKKNMYICKQASLKSVKMSHNP